MPVRMWLVGDGGNHMPYIMAVLAFVQYNADYFALIGGGVLLVFTGTLALAGWTRDWRRRRALRAKEFEADQLLAQRDMMETQVDVLLRELLSAHVPGLEETEDPNLLVTSLMAWAEQEHGFGRYEQRDDFVQAALHIACKHSVATDEFVGRLPKAVVEPQVRTMISTLIAYGPQGHRILERAVGAATKSSQRPMLHTVQ